MTGQHSVRAASKNAPPAPRSTRARLAFRLGLASAILLITLAALAAFSTPASAGWAQTNCPQRFIEVDDDYVASSLINCQFKTILEVELLPLTSGDVVRIYNGSYIANWTMNMNGVSLVGENRKAVVVYSVAPLASPFVVRGSDINVSGMTLIGATYAMDAATGVRLNLTDITLQGNGSFACVCHQNGMVVRNVGIVNSPDGFYSIGSGILIEGLTINVTASSTWKMVLGGSGSRVSNVTMIGAYSSRASLYYYLAAGNTTLENVFMENSTYGIWWAVGDTLTTFRNFTVNNTAYAFWTNAPGRPAIDGFDVGVTSYGVYAESGSTVQLSINRGNIHGATQPVYWYYGSSLTLTNSTISNTSSNGIEYFPGSGLPLTLINVSFENLTGGYAVRGNEFVNWTAGGINNSLEGVYVDYGGRVRLDGVVFSNIADAGLILAGGDRNTVTNSTFYRIGTVVSMWDYQYGPVFTNNRFEEVLYSCINIYGEFFVIQNNTFLNASRPVQWYLDAGWGAYQWHNLTPDNLIEGRPIIKVENATNITLPTNVSMVFILNSTNIALQGINYSSTNLGVGIQVTRSANITLADVWMNADNGVRVMATDGVRITNATFLAQNINSAFYFETSNNINLRNVSAWGQFTSGQGVSVYGCNNVTLDNFLGYNVGTGLNVGSSQFVNVTRFAMPSDQWQVFSVDSSTFVSLDQVLSIGGPSYVTYSNNVSLSNALILNSTSYGLYGDSSQYVTVTNFTAMNPQAAGLHLENSNNWTVRNSTFASNIPFGGYIRNSPNLRTYNSTYVSLGGNSFYVDNGCFAIIVIHNNFYGGPVYNGNGYGTWDGGFPVAGNYYAYAVSGFVDERTGPGQNILVGHDGIKDAPAYPIGGGKNDNYALMDPWPPAVQLTSPPDGSLIKAGTPLNFSISNFFDLAVWTDTAGGNGTFAYPHDINTTGWADGWHTITIVASDTSISNASLAVPTVIRSFSFEFDSTRPLLSATPALGTPAIAQGVVILADAADPHLLAWGYRLDGVWSNNTTLPWSIDTALLSSGSHTVLFFANDTLNNTATYLWTFYVDHNFPTLVRTSPSSDYFQPGTAVLYTAADDFNLSTVAYTATEVAASWSYSGNLSLVGADWVVDTSSFADGCYDLDVFATDAAGHITPDSWALCVDSTNPDLSAFVEFFADEDVPYTFEGNLIVELDTSPIIEWTFDDTVPIPLTLVTGFSPTHTFPTPGAYNVYLYVEDRAGNWNEIDFTLWVLDSTPPTPSFSLPSSWNEDDEFTFDATGTTDNDAYWDGGNNGTFDWDVTDPGGSLVTVSGITAPFTPTEPGVYTILLKVWDRNGNYADLELPLTVSDITPPSIVVTGSQGPFSEGDRPALDASTSYDNDPASVLVFSWRFTYGTPQVISGAAFSFQFVTPGSYAIDLHVADGVGNEAVLPIELRVNDVPAIGATPPAPLSIQAGNGYEWDPTIVDSDAGDTHNFTLLSGPAAMVISPAGVITWSTSAGSYGVYNIAFRVSDGFASVNYSYVLTVTRPADPANLAPFFSSFPIQNGTPGQSYTYAVRVGDPNTGDQLTLALAQSPAGMTIDASKTIHWQIPPTTTDGTVFNVQLLLSDGLIQVYQNFTIRVRASDSRPLFAAGKVPPSVTVDEGKETTIVFDSTFATDPDDNFADLSFFATASDGSVLGVSWTRDASGWTLHITGLKAGTTSITLRVADPSGSYDERSIPATVVSTTAAPGGFPLMLLLLLAALGAAGVVGIVVMKRRKKDEAPAPITEAPQAPPARAPTPSRPVAEEVQVEVVQAPAAASRPSVPLAAAVAVGAGVAAAAAARPAPLPASIEPVKPAKAATYVVEGLFLIYQDGRMIYSKTDIGQQQLADPELVSSMFTAVTQFIKDSFSAEGELNKMGYGENQIVIERGNHLYLAVITFGEPDKELQEKLQTAIEKIEYSYAGVVENWDGQQNRFSDIPQYIAPVLALTAGVTRQDVLAATTVKDVKVLSQLEFFQGFVRLKVGVKNDTEAVVTKVTLDIDYNEDVLRLQRIEPASYKTSGARVMLNVLNPGEKSSVAFYFDPQICTETNIDGIVRFRDYKGVLASVTMKTRKAEVVCPLFFTKEHANTAMLKRLIENELQEKDSKIYTITKLPPYVKHKDIFDVCKSVVLSHDVHMVREFVSYNPFSGEAWFYGETKVKGYKIVIRAAVREDNTIEFFAASSIIKAVTGLLAEFNHTLVSMIVERYSDVKIEQVYDETKKHEIQAKALIDKLGEGEAGAGETDQK